MERIINYRIFLVILSFFLSISTIFSASKGDNKFTAEQWQSDITYLINEMAKVHLNPYHKTTKENFEEISTVLKGKMSSMSDNEIITELARLTALIGDGHTALNIFGFHENSSTSGVKFHIFPLRVYIFPEGLYVTGAAPQYNKVQGSRILKINGMDFNEVIEKVKPLVPCDNEYSAKFNIPYYLVIPEFLNGLGIIPDINSMELTVMKADGKEESVKVNSIEMANMQHNSGASDDNGLPLYMRNDEKNYWFEYLNDSKTLYINYKRVLIDPKDSLKYFCKRIEEFAKTNDIERTVIDIRNNGGGNNGTCQPFVNMISNNPKINVKGKLFVITGRQTFSAASYLTTKLEFNTKAIFVGEPTCASQNHYGDNRPLILPNSKLEIRLSSLFWQNSFPFDKRTATEPELKIETTAKDYFEGKDPVMEAILNYKYAGQKNTGYDNSILGTYLYSPLQTLVISSNGNELTMKIMQVDFLGRNISFISTGLYPEGNNTFASDIRDLSAAAGKDVLKLNYYGKTIDLKRVSGDFKTPQQLLDEGKYSEAIDMIRAAKEKDHSYRIVSEGVINSLGYNVLAKKNYEGALAVFSLNCELYPDSFNAYDSLGEAHMMAGNYKEAIENYKKSVELNPDNNNGRKMLEKLMK